MKSSFQTYFISIVIAFIIIYWVDYWYGDNVARKKHKVSPPPPPGNNNNNKNNKIFEGVESLIRNSPQVKKNLETHTPSYFVKDFQALKYIYEWPEVLGVMKKLRFLIQHDRSRYNDLFNLIEHFMKIYTLILAEKWNVLDFYHILLDIRIQILELMYSFYIVAPENIGFLNFDPKTSLSEAIETIKTETLRKIQIIQKFGKIKQDVIHFDDIHIKPHNMPSSIYLVP
jgi:hypothetical protein